MLGEAQSSNDRFRGDFCRSNQFTLLFLYIFVFSDWTATIHKGDGYYILYRILIKERISSALVNSSGDTPIRKKRKSQEINRDEEDKRDQKINFFIPSILFIPVKYSFPRSFYKK